MRRLWRWLRSHGRRRRKETAEVLAESYETEARLWELTGDASEDGERRRARMMAEKRRREARALREQRYDAAAMDVFGPLGRDG